MGTPTSITGVSCWLGAESKPHARSMDEPIPSPLINASSDLDWHCSDLYCRISLIHMWGIRRLWVHLKGSATGQFIRIAHSSNLSGRKKRGGGDVAPDLSIIGLATWTVILFPDFFGCSRLNWLHSVDFFYDVAFPTEVAWAKKCCIRVNSTLCLVIGAMLGL